MQSRRMIVTAGLPLDPHNGGIVAVVRERINHPLRDRLRPGPAEVLIGHEAPAARECDQT